MSQRQSGGDGVWLLAILVGAFLLRTWPSMDTVLPDTGVRFIEGDAWHHMRIVDALVRDYPRRIHYDAFAAYGGQEVPTAPLLSLLVAGLALLLGGGSPDAHLADRIGAWVPPILGTLIVLPIYALGRSLFDRCSGRWAAAIYAVLPGVALQRTSLGFLDHHVLELLCTTLVLWAAVAALRYDARHRLSWGVKAERHRNLQMLVRAAAAGMALGAYLLSWTGAAFLVAVLFIWMTTDFLWRLQRGTAIEVPALILAISAAVALPIGGVFAGEITGLRWSTGLLAAVLAIACLAAAAAPVIGRLAVPWRAPVALALLAAPMCGSALIWPDLRAAATDAVRRLGPREARDWVGELQPLAAVGWLPGLYDQFATAWLFAGVGLAIAFSSMVRTRSSGLLLLLIFSAATLAATIGMVRFSLYLAIAVAVLAGAAAAQATSWKRSRWLTMPVLGIALIAPTAHQAVGAGRQASMLEPWWEDAMHWLGANSPEPFGDPEAYFRRFPRPAAEVPFAYPDSAYSVMAWWDYGYWIQRIARRIPVANPTLHGHEEAAAFLLAGTAADAMARLDRWRSRYVVIDSALAVGPGPWKLEAITAAAGRQPSEFWTRCRVPLAGGGLLERPVFFPAYYESMAVRLSVFAGRAVEPSNSTWLVTLAERRQGDGSHPCEIASAVRFPTYEAALRAMPQFPGARIAGLSIAASPVPLEKVGFLREIYQSEERGVIPNTRMTAARVRIFKYDGHGHRHP